MLGAGSFDLLHLVGFLTGAVLYGMLVVMVARPPTRPDAFALSTGLLGLVWNVGELAAYAARLVGLDLSTSWIHAVSFTALGLLASVVVHSVARAPARLKSQPHAVGIVVAAVVYACATFAGIAHFVAAYSGQTLPSPLGLTVLTFGLLAVIPALITAARRQLSGPRALWMAALAVVAALMLLELWISTRNERALVARGALTAHDPVYGTMRWAYPAVFVAMAVEGMLSAPVPRSLVLAGAAVFLAAKLFKFWAIATLGERWTYKVLVLPGVPLVTSGPYRFIRHPNYVGVVGELIGMALLTEARFTGAAGVVFFSWLLSRRIRAEEQALR